MLCWVWTSLGIFKVQRRYPDRDVRESLMSGNEELVAALPALLFLLFALGFACGLIGICLPSRDKGRAVWGIVLNGLLGIVSLSVIAHS
jgi:hypothetical protein